MTSASLLQTKLQRPHLRAFLVARPHLLDILSTGQNNCLTLISAPAGYGKTTLAAGWLQEIQTPSVWLSLDESDNDPRQFLRYLLAALHNIKPDIGLAVEAMLQSPQPARSEIIMTSLVNDILALTQPFILVIDDYHVIHTPPIHQQLNFLLEHCPPQMHVVLISREDPPLPLSRLRAWGGVTEIRQTDLRFSTDECAGFLEEVMGLHLSWNDIQALERRTEGWIAGLQLAGLSMRGQEDIPQFIQSFTGSSRFILDYLVEEVFARLAPGLQDFLLKTSILERMCGPLCDAVVGTPTAGRGQSVLESLERSNLFIIPLDQARHWYRYHRLFAELLRQRLQQASHIGPVSELYVAACEWLAKEALFPEAIRQALAGAEWNRAADLIADQSIGLLRNGELMTLLGWIKSLPEDVICMRPQLCRDYGWALTLTGQLDAASYYFKRAEIDAEGHDVLLGTILVGQAYNLRLRGSYQQAIEYAYRAQKLLPGEDHLSHGLLAVTLGFALWNSNRIKEAEQAFLAVDEAAQKSNNHYARITALAFLGAIQAVYGRLHRAAELCQQVIQSAGQSPTAGPAYIELGAVFYELNDLEVAARYLSVGIEQSERVGNWISQCDGYRNLALLHLASGEHKVAQAILQKAHQLARIHEVNPLTLVRNAACQVQISLAEKDYATAQYWADQVTEPSDACLLFPSLKLTPVRMLMAHSRWNEAAEKLKELYEFAVDHDFGAGLIEIRVLQALVARTPNESLHFLHGALTMGEPEGFIRPFVDKGEPMKRLLEHLEPESRDLKKYIQALLSSFHGLDRDSQGHTPVEPMSERELEILQLLADGLSNREIAARLVISVGTVKTHVHHILEKLGGESRLQAVAKARDLGLL